MILPPISTIIANDPVKMACPLYPSSVFFATTSLQKTIQDLLLPYRFTIANIEDLPHHLHRIYCITLASGSRLTLRLPPPTASQLLRHERTFLKNEACALSILAKTNLPIPKIIEHDRKGSRFGTTFLLTTHLPGISYADALPYLTRSERRGIESQLRTSSSVVSQHRATTFGPAALVAARKGFRTWREAFTFMMESVLMDGEDMMVNLPYIVIREVLATSREVLEEVQEARLAILGFGSSGNVLIERKTNKVTGLLDCSQAVWGDPAFATPESCTGRKGLFYAIYYAVVIIVTNHYRPQRNAKELDARKTLTSTLAQLAVKREDCPT